MYVDAHMHFPRNKQQSEKVLKMIKQVGVRVMAVSVDIPSYCEVKEMSEKEKYLDISFGIHPNEASRYVNCLEEIHPYLEEAPRIGEIGLCRYWAGDFEAQKKVFEYQIKYAAESGKTVNLHTAGFEWEMIEILGKYMPPAALIHWYSGSIGAFRELNAMGCYFSFGVNLIANATDALDSVKSDIPVTRKILPLVPKNRILTETDGIDARKWIDGISSYADSIPQITQKISELSGVNNRELCHRISRNYNTFIAI